VTSKMQAHPDTTPKRVASVWRVIGISDLSASRSRVDFPKAAGLTRLKISGREAADANGKEQIGNTTALVPTCRGTWCEQCVLFG